MIPSASSFSRLSRAAARFSVIPAFLAIALVAGCETENGAKQAAPPPAAAVQPTGPIAQHPLTGEEPGFVRLGNMNPNHVPVRIGMLLPFNNGSAATRALAASMMKSAELAIFDAGNPDILLLTADEGSTPEASAEAARTLLAQGAEIIVGPLFAQAAEAVGPVARDHGVPVISFSTDRHVAGNGVYLLSFLPEGEVHRVISYAATQGHANFAALVPQNAYGERVGDYFRDDVKSAGGKVADVEKYVPATEGIAAPAHAVGSDKARCDLDCARRPAAARTRVVARRRRRKRRTGEIARHGIVGRSGDVERSDAGRRIVRRAVAGSRCRLRTEISQRLRLFAAAAGVARLRCGVAGRAACRAARRTSASPRRRSPIPTASPASTVFSVSTRTARRNVGSR